MGLGGINSWGAEPLNAYLLKTNREYSHKFRIAPVRKKLNDPTEYSLLGFRNFGWNDLPAASYGPTEIDNIYKNQPETDITEENNEEDNGEEKNDENPAIIHRIADIPANNDVRNYNVFDTQGRLMASFTTIGIEDLRQRTKECVRQNGLYIVKSKTGGQAFRITVRK